ncbi:hypothetical protein AJ80_00192 [Polytolypa hystricis UAMH7299]|uniref:Uncharacterized protein n=1 Tax=Polytolypa hystricis (strain UAMH7299) TaxID=1447883 RepID=A0A2B7Z483_POLH7|nr:hypothetical protein AJ80_00192 [Polytolypa hystricis UAMH7299]
MATTISFTTTSHLQVLLDPDTSQDKWLATLPGSGPGALILAYEYATPFVGTKPSWESILMLGYDLLKHLSDARSQSNPALPIVIVCHSLGGIVVKQALCIANKQYPRYGSVVNAIAGVVFLSAPHRYGDKITMSLLRFRDVLEATTGRNLKIPNANIEQEGAILLDLADRFEGISFRTPILSVYELRESKISSTPLRPKYQLLVNREACSTQAPMETVIGLNLNHHETCLFTKSVGGEGLPEFNKFIYETLHDAMRLVALRLEDQEYQYATMSAYSPTMSELPLKVEQLELTEWPSNEATECSSTRAKEGTSLSGFELVYPTILNTEVRKTLHLPCYLLNTHLANEDFCGREDILERLAAELLPSKNIVTASGTALRQFALDGFGGMGKTEIAREFSRRHKASFDAVFWVVADEIAKLDYHYQQISLALGLEDSSECKSQVVSREIVKGWLSNPRKHLSGSNNMGFTGVLAGSSQRRSAPTQRTLQAEVPNPNSDLTPSFRSRCRQFGSKLPFIQYSWLPLRQSNFPAIRACIFDMDGLLINSEDIITLCTNQLLEKYGRPTFTRSIRAQTMGIPNSTNGDVFHNWAKLPISREQFALELTEQMHLRFPNCTPLPGAEKLLSNLSCACSASSGDRIELALASSTKSQSHELKTSRSETKQLLRFFQPDRRILGDDPRVPHGRGKPAPDIYLVALQALNAAADSGEKAIMPNECLVFEDSVVGVEAGRRAGMRVVWVPHLDVAVEYQARLKDALAGRTGMFEVRDDWQLGEIEWAETIPSLEHFNYEKYGIDVPS